MYKKLIEDIINKYEYIIVSKSIEFFEATQHEGFVRGSLLFIDGTILYFFEYVAIINKRATKLKYRYHYETENGNLIFRYDNAPHHKEIKTFPHHKHTKDGITASKEPDLASVLDEIAKQVILVQELLDNSKEW